MFPDTNIFLILIINIIKNRGQMQKLSSGTIQSHCAANVHVLSPWTKIHFCILLNIVVWLFIFVPG